MSLSNLTVKQLFGVGDGVNTTFAIPFDFQFESEIVVYIRDISVTPNTEVLQVLSTNYTLTGSPATDVEFNVAPTSSEKVLLIRVTAETQTNVYSDVEPFPAVSQSNGLDKLTQQSQEQSEEINRSIRSSSSEVFNGELPPGLTALEVLQINDAGDGIQTTPLVSSNAVLATQSQAESGTDNTTFMSPLRVMEAARLDSPSNSEASNFTAFYGKYHRINSSNAITITMPDALNNNDKRIGFVSIGDKADLFIENSGGGGVEGVASYAVSGGKNFGIIFQSIGGTWKTVATSGEDYLEESTSSSGGLRSSGTIVGDTTSGDVTMTLLTAAAMTGRKITYHKKVDANVLTIDGSGSETINGKANIELLMAGDSATLMSDGSNWIIVDKIVGPKEYTGTDSTSGAWPFVAGAYGDLTSISVTPGKYRFMFVGGAAWGGTSGTSTVTIGVSTTSGNSSTGLIFGTNAEAAGLVATAFDMRKAHLSDYIVDVAATTTFYLKGRLSVIPSGGSRVPYMLKATRIDF